MRQLIIPKMKMAVNSVAANDPSDSNNNSLPVSSVHARTVSISASVPSGSKGNHEVDLQKVISRVISPINCDFPPNIVNT